MRERDLPLFRPEVVEAQQQKALGEVLRIRPFPIGLFIWLGIALAGIVITIVLLEPKPL